MSKDNKPAGIPVATNEDIAFVKDFLGAIRGAQIEAEFDGDKPRMTLEVVTGIQDGCVVLARISLDAAAFNANGEPINRFSASGVRRPAYPSDAFVVKGETLKIRLANEAPSFLVHGDWTKVYSETATKCQTKVKVLHRINLEELARNTRPTRSRDGSWQNLPDKETVVSLPDGKGPNGEDRRRHYKGIKKFIRLSEGGKVHLLPLPAELVTSVHTTAAAAVEL